MEESPKYSIWLTGKKITVLSENKTTLSYKPESTINLVIRDIIYQCRARDDAQKVIQDVGMKMFSCLLCFYAGICTKEDEMNGHQSNYPSNAVQIKRQYTISVV